MPRVTCSDCSVEIPPADVNVGEGVAYCRACGGLSRLAEIADDEEVASVDASVTPPGCAIHDHGVGMTIRASARSIGGAMGGLFAAAFWNGIVSVFVLIALGGTINLFGAVPSWFPAPNFGSSGGMPIGMVLFMWVFLMPFIAIGLLLLAACLTALLGRVEVRVRHGQGVAFTGFGPIGWKRRFDAAAVKSVRMGQTTWKENDRSKPVVVIEADRTIRIGSILPADRRAWLAAVLRELLVL